MIRTEGADGWAIDLRTACVGGRPVVVFVKQKPAALRCSNSEHGVVVKDRRRVFSPQELRRSLISAAEMNWIGVGLTCCVKARLNYLGN